MCKVAGEGETERSVRRLEKRRRTVHSPLCRVCCYRCYCGQVDWMNVVTVGVSSPLIQLTMPFQNEFDPTAAGIRSDASNRNVVFGSCKILMLSTASGDLALFGSRPLLALMTPPIETRLFAQR